MIYERILSECQQEQENNSDKKQENVSKEQGCPSQQTDKQIDRAF